MTEPLKYCKKCSTTKTTDNFHKDKSKPDGLATTCRECKLASMRQYEASEAGKLKRKAYQQSEAGKASVQKYKSSEKYQAKEERWKESPNYVVSNRERSRKYKQSEHGKEKRIEYLSIPQIKVKHNAQGKKHRELNPLKTIARTAVSNAIKQGNIAPIKTQRCSTCSNQAQEYHHPDYSQPLNVVPLCIACHRRIHRS